MVNKNGIKECCFLLCITVLFSMVFSIPAYAATSGTAGSCQWTLDGTVLTITGNGKLLTPYGNGPWGNDITEVIICEGITSIEGGVFADCKYLTKVTLPASLRAIKYSAFSSCTALTSIVIPTESQPLTPMPLITVQAFWIFIFQSRSMT